MPNCRVHVALGMGRMGGCTLEPKLAWKAGGQACGEEIRRPGKLVLGQPNSHRSSSCARRRKREVVTILDLSNFSVRYGCQPTLEPVTKKRGRGRHHRATCPAPRALVRSCLVVALIRAGLQRTLSSALRPRNFCPLRLGSCVDYGRLRKGQLFNLFSPFIEDFCTVIGALHLRVVTL